MYFYLKINQNEPFAYRNLQNWINVITGLEQARMVVISDKPEITKNIKNVCRLVPGIEFISSERDEEVLKELCVEITDDRWRNAGYAHLTTFWHASQQRDCEAFWNIDADDTYLCLSEERTREVLIAAEKKARQEGILIYSLDMHTSRGKGEPWSFGITYTDNSIDWLDFMKSEASHPLWEKARKIESDLLHLLNIDMFFTYILKKQYGEGRKRIIGTFYLDHSWFIHYSKDFLGLAFFSGLYQWRNERIYTPLFSDLLKAGKFQEGQVIPENVDKIDVSITEDESLWGLQKYVFFGPLNDGNRALVDELPFHETEQWGILNQLLGYHCLECKENEEQKPDAWREMLSSLKSLYSDGEDIYKMLRESRPDGSEIIICPGHMGDTLLIAALSREYKEQHGIQKLIYVSVSLPEEILKCYPAIDATLMLEESEMNSLRFYMMIRKLWYQNGIRYAHFQEEVVLNYPKVASKDILDYRSYSFRFNRMKMMDLEMDSVFDPLYVSPMHNYEQLLQEYRDAVLLMPVSYSTHMIPESFWEKLTDELQARGYTVYTNYNGAPSESVIKGTRPFQSSFYEMAQMTNVFSLFVGTRSGLCDLISLTGNGRLVVLYNETVLECSGDLEIAEEEIKESYIYDLGRRNGIFCYRYLSRDEEKVIEAVCNALPEKKEVLPND